MSISTRTTPRALTRTNAGQSDSALQSLRLLSGCLGEKELEVKALGEELAGELVLGQVHLMLLRGFCWWSEVAEATPFIDLGPVLFFDIKQFAARFRFCRL